MIGHLAEKQEPLRNMLRATRPGGWLLVEDVDFIWTEVGAQPIEPDTYAEPYMCVWRPVVDYMKERGFDGHWGRHAAGALRSAGFEQVSGEASTLVGDPDLTKAMRLTVARFGPELVRSGRVTEPQLAKFDALMADPHVLFTGSPTFSLWGRRRCGE